MSDNLFRLPLEALADERVETLVEARGVRIERILSDGQASPPGFWYDQREGEWVVLLAGEADLRLGEEGQTRRLKPGDFLHLPPHCKHRIERTSETEKTIWLAVFYDE